jgi:hypothetical protein
MMSVETRTTDDQGAGTADMLKFACSIAVTTAVLAAVPAQAQTSGAGGAQEQWGAWTSSAGGFVARRRELVGMDRIHARQASQRSGSGAVPADQETMANDRTPAIVARQTAAETAVAAGLQRAGAAWLYNGGEGLYRVSVDQVSAILGRPVAEVESRAASGNLILTGAAGAGAETSSRGHGWFYHAASRAIYYPAEAYRTFHSDHNAYNLRYGKAGAGAAQPMPEIGSPLSGLEASPSPFRDHLHFEQEPGMNFLTPFVNDEPDADYWWWQGMREGIEGSDFIAVELDIPNPDPLGEGRISITLRGFTDLQPGADHRVAAELNGVYLGEVSWDGLNGAELVAEFSAAGVGLQDGPNTLTLRNISPEGSGSGQFLDAIDLDYDRLPVTSGGRLWLHQAAGGPQRVDGLDSPEVVVIEAPVGDARLRRDIAVGADGAGGWTLRFDAEPGVDYLIASLPAAPEAAAAPDYRSALRRNRNGARYLIIAPRAFAASARALADLRAASFGSVEIAWLDDIYDEFSAGRSDPAALARFMRWVVQRWVETPSHVALWGRGTVDGLDRLGLGDSYIPLAFSANPWDLALSDSRLLGYEDDAPFAIGRIPIVSDVEGMDYVTKLERGLYGAADFAATVTADNPDSGGEFHAAAEATARQLRALGMDPVDLALYRGTDNPVREALTAAATWNRALVVYQGHGNRLQAGRAGEDFLTRADADSLVNTRHGLLSVLSCAVGDDRIPGIEQRSLAARLVLNPDGGPISAVVPTSLSLDPEARVIADALVQGLFSDGYPVGEALRQAKFASGGQIQPFMPRTYTVIGESAAGPN